MSERESAFTPEAQEELSNPAPAGEEPRDMVSPDHEMVSFAAVDKIIDDWFEAHIRNSPIARHTPSWSHMNDAIAALKTRLQGLRG